MRYAIALMMLALTATAQTNVIVGTVADYGLTSQSNIQVTATLLYPAKRSVSGTLIRQDPVTTYTDTNGIFYFTNFIWGKYQLLIAGQNGTSFNFWVNTNTTGTNQITALLTPVSLSPTTNYYTIEMADSLFIAKSNLTELDARYIANLNGRATNFSASETFNLVSSNVPGSYDEIELGINQYGLPTYEVNIQNGITTYIVQVSQVTTNGDLSTIWYGDFIESGNLPVYGTITAIGGLQMPQGAGAGKVPMSDASGNLTLQTPTWAQFNSVLLTNEIQKILEWTASGAYQVTNSIVDSDGVIITAGVLWPDGLSGTFTTKAKDTNWLCVNAYTVTRSDGTIVTQSALSRNSSSGAATNIPPLILTAY